MDVYSDEESEAEEDDEEEDSENENKLRKAKLDVKSDDDEDGFDAELRSKREELARKKKTGRKIIETDDEEESD